MPDSNTTIEPLSTRAARLRSIPTWMACGAASSNAASRRSSQRLGQRAELAARVVEHEDLSFLDDVIETVHRKAPVGYPLRHRRVAEEALDPDHDRTLRGSDHDLIGFWRIERSLASVLEPAVEMVGPSLRRLVERSHCAAVTVRAHDNVTDAEGKHCVLDGRARGVIVAPVHGNDCSNGAQDKKLPRVRAGEQIR